MLYCASRHQSGGALNKAGVRPSVCLSVCPMSIAEQEGHAVAGAGHLHINLAANSQVTQQIERTLKLSANIGKLSKTTLQVYQWRTDACCRIVSRDPWTKVHKIQETKFQLARPSTLLNLSLPIKSARDIRCGKIWSWKSRPKFTLGHQICHQLIGHTRVSRHSVVTLALDCFVSGISLVLCWKCHFKIWICSHRVRSMSSVVLWARYLG